jgi:hypothetical protein
MRKKMREMVIMTRIIVSCVGKEMPISWIVIAVPNTTVVLLD